MTDTVDIHAANEGGVSRRRILQGAAWAAPAIVVATAVPAAAASASAELTNSSLVIEQNGNSKNFILEWSANITGVANGELMSLMGYFDAGSATAEVTDNSSGWNVTTPSGTGSSFSWTATRVHDGTSTLAVAKFKINLSSLAEIEGTPVALYLFVGSQQIGLAATSFPTLH